MCKLVLLISCDILFQCGNMAREGLRTLVVGKKVLSEEQYADFEVRKNWTGLKHL